MKIIDKIFKNKDKENLVITEANVKNTIKGSFIELDNIRKYIFSLKCPCCNKVSRLRVVTYTKGNTEWEAKIFCEECKANGILNQSGISVSMSYYGIASIGEVNG